MTRYDTETPKHLMAIAKSKKTAADGYVILEHAKKEDWRPARAATCVSNSKPKAEAEADNRIIKTPNPSPTPANAAGIASIPDPRMVLVMLRIEERSVPVGISCTCSRSSSKGAACVTGTAVYSFLVRGDGGELGICEPSMTVRGMCLFEVVKYKQIPLCWANNVLVLMGQVLIKQVLAEESVRVPGCMFLVSDQKVSKTEIRDLRDAMDRYAQALMFRMAACQAQDHSQRHLLGVEHLKSLISNMSDLHQKLISILFHHLSNEKGLVDVRDLVCGICTLLQGSPSQRLACMCFFLTKNARAFTNPVVAFELYNLDETNRFNQEDLFAILISALEAFKIAHSKKSHLDKSIAKGKSHLVTEKERSEIIHWVETIYNDMHAFELGN